MYIDPFWAGVAATVLAELAAFFMLALFGAFKKRNK